MTTTLRLAVSTDDEIHTVTMTGCLDETSCSQLITALEGCRAPGARVLLDVRGLDFMDAAGMGVLDCAYTKAAEEGWTFAVMTPGERYVARAPRAA